MWGVSNEQRRFLEWVLVGGLTAVAAWLRFYNLGKLGLWGDEGFTYLAVEGILKHGLPILPSGNGYYKDLLYTYLTALPCLFGGITEGALRTVNALWSVALIPVMYRIGKRHFPIPLAMIGAAILALSHWEIEFGRQARYYCQLQLFYLLAIHYFWRGFGLNHKPSRNLTVLFFFLASLTHQLAYTLVFCFPVLAMLKGPRVLWHREPGEKVPRILLLAILMTAWVVLLEWFEIYFWQTGSVAHIDNSGSAWKALFKDFHWGYFLEFNWLFPKMSWVALAGVFFAFIWRKEEPLSFMVTLGVVCLLFMGFGHAHLQPRYIFYLFPVFIMAYLAGLYGTYRLTRRIFLWTRLPAGKAAGLAAMSALFFITVEAVNPRHSFAIPKVRYGKRLDTKFQISTTLYHRIDYETTGKFVREKLEPGDIVVGMHMIYQHIYAGRCDYWLWSAGPRMWDAHHSLNGKRADRYLGIPVLQKLDEFKKLLGESKGKRVWVVATPSLYDKGHIRPEILDYFTQNESKAVYRSPDGLSRVYLFQP